MRSGCLDAIIRFAVPSAIYAITRENRMLNTEITKIGHREHGEILKNGIFLYVRAARPFGALKDCNDALSNFSKLPAPFSRRASATAPSAARAS